MVGAGIGRRKEQKDEIDGTAVDRLVVERLGKAREQAVDLLYALDLAMRNCDSVPKAGRAELLTLGDARENCGRIEIEPLRRKAGELLQQRLLASARKARLDRVEIEEIQQMHSLTH